MNDKLYSLIPLIPISIIVVCFTLNRTKINQKLSKNPMISIFIIAVSIVSILVLASFILKIDYLLI